MTKNFENRQIKVLVVEDDIEQQDLLKTYLEILGCQIYLAANGMQAIEKLIDNKYDICFMDLQMPLMGGLEATKIIREEEQQEMPIFGMTEIVTDEDFEDCRSIKMTGLINKPVDFVKLKKIIIHFGRKKINDK